MKLFTQLITMHTMIGYGEHIKMIPLMFAFVERKKEKTQKSITNYIYSKLYKYKRTKTHTHGVRRTYIHTYILIHTHTYIHIHTYIYNDQYTKTNLGYRRS